MNLKRAGVSYTGRRLYRRVPVTAGVGFASEHYADETAEIEVLIDVHALVAAIGHRALASKKGVSKVQGGALTLRVLNRKQKNLEAK